MARRLGDDEAAAFEVHYFTCEACWSELQKVTALQAGMVDGRASKSGRTASRQRRLSLAAAAALVVLAVSTFVWQSRHVDRGRPLRGEAPSLELDVHRGADGSVVAGWRTHPAAASYRVQAFDEEGRSLFENETSSIRLVVPPSAIPDASEPSYWRVQALDALRHSIAESDLIVLENRQ